MQKQLSDCDFAGFKVIVIYDLACLISIITDKSNLGQPICDSVL